METPIWLKPHTPGAPDQGSAGAGSSSRTDGSLGEQIDHALGEFDDKLSRLRETLEEKKAEMDELVEQIAATEKEQAKAFKALLSRNRQIKKMLDPKAKKPAARRRKSGGDTAPTAAPTEKPPASDAGGGIFEP